MLKAKYFFSRLHFPELFPGSILRTCGGGGRSSEYQAVAVIIIVIIIIIDILEWP